MIEAIAVFLYITGMYVFNGLLGAAMSDAGARTSALNRALVCLVWPIITCLRFVVQIVKDPEIGDK